MLRIVNVGLDNYGERHKQNLEYTLRILVKLDFNVSSGLVTHMSARELG